MVTPTAVDLSLHLCYHWEAIASSSTFQGDQQGLHIAPTSGFQLNIPGKAP